MRSSAPSVTKSPLATGLPLLGNVIPLATNVIKFLTEQYRIHGSVFRVRALQREMIVLAGVDANLFFMREGKRHFRSAEFWRGQDQEFGAARSLISMDGDEHTRFRKAQRAGYSRSYLLDHLSEAVNIARTQIAQWPIGEPQPALYSLQKIVTEQLAVITANHSVRDDLDAIITAVRTIIATRVTQQRPAIMRQTPRFKAAKARFLAIADDVIAGHSASEQVRGDLIDDILTLHREAPDFLPEADLLPAVLGPFIAGLDTVASTSAFILYALLKDAELARRVTAEADALFADGVPTGAALRKLDVLHRVALEAMRLWSIAPALTRTVTNAFTFGGYHIPAQSTVILATTVPHHLETYFPNPEKFDIDRYLPERREHKIPGVYAPFGLGAHTCLGQGFAEVQMALTLATLFHAVELRLSPADYELGLDPVPTLSPDKKMQFEVVRRR